jgi:hypothetical protein
VVAGSNRVSPQKKEQNNKSSPDVNSKWLRRDGSGRRLSIRRTDVAGAGMKQP